MQNESERAATQGTMMKWGMMACCAVMPVPVASFLLAGGTIAGLWTSAGLIAPIAICVGAHLVVHRMMGKSCHRDRVTAQDPVGQPNIGAGDRGQPAAMDIVRSA